MSHQKEMQQLWASEKYRVMYFHQKSYNEIRQFMAEPGTTKQLQKLIDHAFTYTPTIGSTMNTFDHIWGYFKKYATTDEKNSCQQLRTQFEHAEIENDVLWSFLAQLAVKYHVEYLKNSTLLRPFIQFL